MKRVRALFYAINGTGCGHISRQLNIAREARVLLHAMGIGADFHLLTTSEAPQQGWDFPTFKLPSKTVVNEADTPNDEYSAHMQFFIAQLVGGFRPDLLVVDTMPQGSYGELMALRAFCKRTALVARHVHPDVAASPVYRSHAALYDALLIPDDLAERERYAFPFETGPRQVYTGLVHGFRREEAWSRADVRGHFGARDGQSLVYVSAGGGGDKRAEADLTRLVLTLAEDSSHLVLVGYGPLYRGRKIYRENVIPLSDPDVRQYFLGLDFAVSAAGYNTFEELLAAGVPSLFFAQPKGMDQQDERVRIGAERGWNRVLASLDVDEIRGRVEEIKRLDVSDAIREALAERNAPQGVLGAAEAILRLHASIKSSPVTATSLSWAVGLRREWPAVAVAQEVPHEEAAVTFVSAARFAGTWAETAFGTFGWQQPSVDRAQFRSVMELGCALARFQRSYGLSERAFTTLVRECAREVREPDVGRLIASIGKKFASVSASAAAEAK